MLNLLGIPSSKPLGKIVVLKSLIASQLVYVLSPLPTKHAALDEINNMFYDFLWSEDIWRYLQADSPGFTFTRWDGSIASRIDLCCVPYVWVSSVSSCCVVPCPFSDYCALLLSLSVPDVVPSCPGLWKLNASILSEDDYYDLISSALLLHVLGVGLA